MCHVTPFFYFGVSCYKACVRQRLRVVKMSNSKKIVHWATLPGQGFFQDLGQGPPPPPVCYPSKGTEIHVLSTMAFLPSPWLHTHNPPNHMYTCKPFQIQDQGSQEGGGGRVGRSIRPPHPPLERANYHLLSLWIEQP